MGKLLTSFEDPLRYNVVNGSSTVTNNIISNVNLSVHGTNLEIHEKDKVHILELQDFNLIMVQ